jgi:hypothetical protein
VRVDQAHIPASLRTGEPVTVAVFRGTAAGAIESEYAWFTTDHAQATRYATAAGTRTRSAPVVTEHSMTLHNPKVTERFTEILNANGSTLAQLRAEGHDGLVYRSSGGVPIPANPHPKPYVWVFGAMHKATPNDKKDFKYSDDQPRADDGKWTSGGGDGGAAQREAPAGAEPTPGMVRMRDGARRLAGEHVGRSDGSKSTATREAMSTNLDDESTWREHTEHGSLLPVTGLPGPAHAFSEAVRDLPYETGAFWDDHENGLLEITNYAEDKIFADDWSDIEGAALFVHNHPEGGVPFSGDDLVLGIRRDIGTVRVVGRLTDGTPITYDFHPPPPAQIIARATALGIRDAAREGIDGHPRVKAARMAGELFDTMMVDAQRAFQPRYKSLVASGMDPRRAEWIATYEAGKPLNERFAKAIGATYTETRGERGVRAVPRPTRATPPAKPRLAFPLRHVTVEPKP